MMPTNRLRRRTYLSVVLALAAGACSRDFNHPLDTLSNPSPLQADVRILEPRDGATVTVPQIQVSGTFAPQTLADTSDIWVLVWPELAGGKAYPQSPNSTRGDSAIIDRANQRWMTTVSLGGPNQSYRISVHTGDLGASRALREYIIEAARTGNHSGLTRDQLPGMGLVERHFVTIAKMEPPLSVQIAEPRAGFVAPAGIISVRGTYAPQSLVDDRSIWVLVWPELAGGKGYPQSPNAEAGEAATIIRANQTWSVQTSLGGPPQTYRISVHTADSEATRVLRDYMIRAAATRDFAGFEPGRLPTGLEERDSVSISKSAP